MAAITFLSYLPVLGNRFVHLDDPFYITENRHVSQGLSRDSVVWAFTAAHTSNWHPLTWLSHMLDCQLFGLQPAGHHVVSLFFHIANALLLFLFLDFTTRRRMLAFLVAALFALHPLHVESVAWVSERKDVLSTFFFLLILLAYSSYVRTCRGKTYLLVLLLYALGLMTKPMLVTVPFILLLLDYWPLRRFRFPAPTGAKPSSLSPQDLALAAPTVSIRRIVLEKIPFLLLAAASSVITFLVQQSSGAMDLMEKLPFAARLANALTSYWIYLYQLFIPVHLAVLYPHPGKDFALWKPVSAAAGLLAVTLFLLIRFRSQRQLLVGWLWFLGTLIPVIGLVQVGTQARADRYTYIPSIGFFILVVWGAGPLFSSVGSFRAKLRLGFPLLFLAICSVLTFRQASYWKDDLTLFGRTLALTKKNYVCHSLYSTYLWQEKKDLEQAIRHSELALEAKPDYVDAMINLGRFYKLKDDFRNSEKYYLQALHVYPNYPLVLNNLAWLYVTSTESSPRQLADALLMARQAAEKTGYRQTGILDTLAGACAANGDFPHAVEYTRLALTLAREQNESHLIYLLEKNLARYLQNKPWAP